MLEPYLHFILLTELMGHNSPRMTPASPASVCCQDWCICTNRNWYTTMSSLTTHWFEMMVTWCWLVLSFFFVYTLYNSLKWKQESSQYLWLHLLSGWFWSRGKHTRVPTKEDKEEEEMDGWIPVRDPRVSGSGDLKEHRIWSQEWYLQLWLSNLSHSLSWVSTILELFY